MKREDWEFGDPSNWYGGGVSFGFPWGLTGPQGSWSVNALFEYLTGDDEESE